MREVKLSTVLLEEFLGTTRLFLIFAPSPYDERYVKQFDELIGREEDMRDRNLMLFRLFDKGTSRMGEDAFIPQIATHLRHEYRVEPGHFEIILVGKDGVEYLRSREPIPADDLFYIIDQMPLRREELRQREGAHEEAARDEEEMRHE